ncbi:hypothetical protein BC938DRAFT_476575 [Jimgerdemannia flammicorona]|uniref:Alpha-N-acetylglucosaminidase n=1 Tax=Jimgerdemannia flammicorona TaxID=994334 RepID=A0A433QQA9_9FUNG|nr:hypothetical protein BC938DRAFT_476575 [Jimgerdemannia flammicorona]
MVFLQIAFLLLSTVTTLWAVPIRQQNAYNLPNGLPISVDIVHDLVKRRLPQHTHSSFIFELAGPQIVPALHDTYTISNAHDEKILIRGSSPIAITSGLNHYLKYYCKVDSYWSSNRFAEIPITLPRVNGTVSGGSNVQWRYYLNVVTFSYSTAWWNFERWEQEIDWMALNGINMPLAFVGQEYVAQKVFKSFGLNDIDISTFLGGPAFLAWQRLGNIQGSWPVPCPQFWIDAQWVLQRRIIHRLRSFGMTPVLPAFAGFVPEAITKAFPNANLTHAAHWANFPPQFTSVTAIYPLDPEFLIIQRRYLHVQRLLYGGWTSHIYNVDLYNELKPASFDPEYLKSSTHGVWKSLKAGDSKAIWMMQGWLFHASYWTNERIAALLAGAPDEDVIVLDLYSEEKPVWNRTDSYYGKPFIWNMLHDFGGNQGLYAKLQVIAKDPLVALNSSNSMVGMGITMEGLNTNEIAYALMLEMPWRHRPVNTTEWVQAFIGRRYGTERVNNKLAAAWELLRRTVYENKGGTNGGVVKSIYELRPALQGLVNRTGKHSTALTYDARDLIDAWHLFLAAAASPTSTLRTLDSFRYDFVDLTRQVLTNLFVVLYGHLILASRSGLPDHARKWGDLVVDLLASMDEVLATDKHFLLGTWIADARKWANGDPELEKFLEYQARNQITLWGPDGEISDYASKQWSGLVSTYYQPRWRIFVNHLVTEWNHTAYLEEVTQFEYRWQTQTWGEREGEVWEVVGDTWEVVQKIGEKWEPVLKEVYDIK